MQALITCTGLFGAMEVKTCFLNQIQNQSGFLKQNPEFSVAF